LRVTFAGASAADYYDVSLVASDGRHLLDVVRGHRHVITLPVIGYQDHLQVSVTPVSELGRRGPAASERG
jgi:hypothetical protein